MVGALAPVEPLPSPLSSRLSRPAVGPKRRDLQFNGPLVETRNTTPPAEVSSRPERSAVEGPAVLSSTNQSSLRAPPSPCHPDRSVAKWRDLQCAPRASQMPEFSRRL